MSGGNAGILSASFASAGATVAGLAAIFGTLSPHPKIPFLADKAQRLAPDFAAREFDLGGAINGGVFAIVAESIQGLQTAGSIPREHRAAFRC